jgi:CRISPR-associated protein Cas2
MQTKRAAPSEYRAMWLVAMFDLPVLTKKDRREYAQFRKALLQEGFLMVQFSVYARYCASEETGDTYKRRIKQALPPRGEIRLMTVTDRQWGRVEVFLGKKRAHAEKAPDQMVLF